MPPGCCLRLMPSSLWPFGGRIRTRRLVMMRKATGGHPVAGSLFGIRRMLFLLACLGLAHAQQCFSHYSPAGYVCDPRTSNGYTRPSGGGICMCTGNWTGPSCDICQESSDCLALQDPSRASCAKYAADLVTTGTSRGYCDITQPMIGTGNVYWSFEFACEWAGPTMRGRLSTLCLILTVLRWQTTSPPRACTSSSSGGSGATRSRWCPSSAARVRTPT
jgi:hypothetical protein